MSLRSYVDRLSCALEPEEAQIWAVNLEVDKAQLDELISVLSPSELLRAKSFRLSLDRDRFVVSHAALRVILSKILGQSPESISYSYSPLGKPRLSGTTSVQFNLSHACCLALIGVVNNYRLGVDVERIDGTLAWESISKRVLTEDEHVALTALPENVRLRAFFRSWTCKEAFTKAIGRGIGPEMRHFEIRETLPIGLEMSLLHHSKASRWSLLSMAFGEQYVGALAVEAKNIRYRKFGWPVDTWPVVSTITGCPGSDILVRV